jgi:putative flippase GtrA
MKALLRKLVRYTAVSAISTSVTLSLLGTLVVTRALSAGWANLVATAVGTVPSFELNRRWVWRRRARRSLLREVFPFCVLSFGGLVISTLAVSLAARWSTGAGLGTGAIAIVSQAANVSTFGALWVVQFVLLDRVLFRARGTQGGGPGALALGPTCPIDWQEAADQRRTLNAQDAQAVAMATTGPPLAVDQRA